MKKLITKLKVESLNFNGQTEDMKKYIINNFMFILNSLQDKLIIECNSEYRNNEIYKQIYISGYNLDLIQRYLNDLKLYSNISTKDENKNIQKIKPNYIINNDIYESYIYVYNWPKRCSEGWLDFIINNPLNIDIIMTIIPVNQMQGIKVLHKKKIQYNVNDEILDEESDTNDIDIMLDELQSNISKLFLMSFVIKIKAKSKKELKLQKKKIADLLISKNIIYKESFLNQLKPIEYYYNFTTTSLKCFFPFIVNDINDINGIYIGKNVINNNSIFLDIFLRGYAVIVILGLMHSGKSYLAKHIIKLLSDTVEITIFDKSGEYAIFKNYNNVNVYSKKSLKEYENILKIYSNKVNDDYNSNTLKPRLLVIDEIWAYLNYSDKFNSLLNEAVLEGRKKYLGICVLSQLIEHLLDNECGNTIIKTANIKFLLKMNLNELKILAKEIQLSNEQINYLNMADHEGIMFVNSNNIKFKVDKDNQFNTSPIGDKK